MEKEEGNEKKPIVLYNFFIIYRLYRVVLFLQHSFCIQYNENEYRYTIFKKP